MQLFNHVLKLSQFHGEVLVDSTGGQTREYTADWVSFIPPESKARLTC